MTLTDLSFRAKLSLAFSTVLLLTLGLVLINWWGVDRALFRQEQTYAFAAVIERRFNQLIRTEQLFRSTERIEQSRAVKDFLVDIRAQLQARSDSRPQGDQQDAIASLFDALDTYEDRFADYNRSLVAMQTMKSRMLKESERLFHYTGKLMEVGKRPGESLLGSAPAANMQFAIGTLLLAEKEYFLTNSEEIAARVQALAMSISAQAGMLERSESDNREKLQAFRIARATDIYLDIFIQCVAEQNKLSEAVHQVQLSRDTFSSALSRYLELSRRQNEEQLGFWRVFSAIVSVAATLIGIAAVVALSNLITRSVNELRKSAQQIVDGNLDTSVSVIGNDDLGQLGHLFNEMCARLRNNFRHIENYRDHLELLVEQRTATLEKEVAEHLATEEALRTSQERLANIVSQSPLGIVVFDRDFIIQEWNPGCERIFGFSREEIIGKHASVIIPETAREQVDNVRVYLLEGRKSIQNQNENITKTGKRIICNWSNTPLTNADDQVVGMLCLVDDITEKLRLEQEVLKIKKLESTGVLAGGIAHDFNNILTAILGNINLSLLDERLPQQTRYYLVAAEKATIRAQSLTQQLLTFAKGGEPVKEQTSLVELIKDSAEFVLHGSATSCCFHFPEDLWMVRADRGQFSQVIQNIVLNASQAMPGGGVIDISCENLADTSAYGSVLDPSQSYVKISIADAGVGIPPVVLDKIFDPYFSTKREGSGLGWAITHSIINKHDGHISVASTPGSGTVFTIFLPADRGFVQPAPQRSSVAETLQPARILLMDDDEMVLNVTRSILQTLGHQVECVREGDECLERFRMDLATGSPPDLVILDLTIPGGKGGEETARELKLIDPSVKVVVSSGYANDSIIASYREYGFCAALSKPYVVEDLAKVIQSTLRVGKS